MKLALFDFDNTLFKTPYDESPSYMDKPESLSIRKWKFEPILETIKKFKELAFTCVNLLHVCII